ncbi:MAG: cyclase family protein [Treponema sp.]|jgi:arylformamidase|nr:cyclase family protein [Treponema sp.]
MKLIDITQTYRPGMIRYRSIEDFHFEWLRHYSQGSGMALSKFSMTSHLGTHIDSPYHFIEGGKKIGDITLETLCGKAQVINACNRTVIDRDFLESQKITAPRLLFKTDNTERLRNTADFDNVFFTEDTGEYLAVHGVILVGFDYFNVDKRGDKSRRAHRSLLSKNIVILEAVFLDGVSSGEYDLYCLPLKLDDLEGAPCRVILQEGE